MIFKQSTLTIKSSGKLTERRDVFFERFLFNAMPAMLGLCLRCSYHDSKAENQSKFTFLFLTGGVLNVFIGLTVAYLLAYSVCSLRLKYMQVA